MLERPNRSCATYRRPLLHGMRPENRLQEDDTDTGRRPKAIRGSRRQQSLMTATEPHEPHVAPDGGTHELDRPFDARRHDSARKIELHELDLDAAVHDDRELVVRRGEPIGRALRAQHLDYVLAILGDDDLLVRSGVRGDIEDVRERVALHVVVDDLDVAFDVARERTEGGGELADSASLEAHSRSRPPDRSSVP